MGRLWLGLMSGAGALAVTTAMVPFALGQLHASWPARGSSQGSAVVGTFPTPAPCTGPEWSGATVHNLVPGQGPFFAGNGKNIVNGSAGPDLVGGGNGMDCLLGAAGDDVLSGGRGNDYIDGGPGFDICFAILGDDTVVNCEVVVPVHDGFQHTPMPASADSADDATALADSETEDQPGGEDARSSLDPPAKARPRRAMTPLARHPARRRPRTRALRRTKTKPRPLQPPAPPARTPPPPETPRLPRMTASPPGPACPPPATSPCSSTPRPPHLPW